MSEREVFRRSDRNWLVAVAAALLVPSVSAIIVIAQMHQKLDDLESRLVRHEMSTADQLEEHGDEAAHGTVGERLTEHDTRLNSQERSLETVRRANDRIYADLSQIKTDLRVLELLVDYEHRLGIDP